MLCLSCVLQVVFTGPTDKAAVHFVSLGVTPPSDNVAVADMVLDLVIKAPRAQVRGCALTASAVCVYLLKT